MIEQAVHFRLVAIEEGSVVPVLELPDPAPFDSEAMLNFDVVTLGKSAVDALLREVKEPSDPVVARAILEVADGMHVGERYEAVVFDVSSNARRRQEVKIDGKVRRRLRRYVDSAPVPTPRTDDLMGVLVEADFEKRTARLRTPVAAGVDVSFLDEHADDIQAALRQSSTLRGEVVYDPKTNTAKSVRLTEIVRGIEQLVLDPGEFWRELSFEELAEQQASRRLVDPDELYDADATDDELVTNNLSDFETIATEAPALRLVHPDL